MAVLGTLTDPAAFSAALFEVMKHVEAGVAELELYEFRYALNNVTPTDGWASIELDAMAEIEGRVNSREFYTGLQVKPRAGDRIVLDPRILQLTVMLFVGLVTEAYPDEWVKRHFYFDVRGFYFLHRTHYLTERVLAHLGGSPLIAFEQRQTRFARCQAIGYKEFKEANAEMDRTFIGYVVQLIAARGTPTILAIAGPTAAGKTEIVARLSETMIQAGSSVTAIEMDNFLTDRDYREERGIHTLGGAAIHLAVLMNCLEALRQGLPTMTPRYDFVNAVSSHDLAGNLKPGFVPLEIQPADIVFIEGNFPFLLEEVAPLIGIKVVYLTDDPIRMKRKWKRDIDYRKKYEPTYFRNRFFKEQFLMAQTCYLPQMEVCDLLVDTTGAAIWATPESSAVLAALAAPRNAEGDSRGLRADGELVGD